MVCKGDIPIRRLPPTGSLEAFIAAGRTGSLSKASVELNLSVSALSRRIQKLEQYVGRSLFTRRGNEFRLNEEGQRLFGEIVQPFGKMMAAFQHHQSPGKKDLVVGVPTSFATAWLIPRLHSFRLANPDIELVLDTSGSPTEKLGDMLDMIVFFAEDGAETLEFQPLRRQGAFVVAQKGLVNPLDGLKASLRKTPLLVHRHLPHLLESWLEAVGIGLEFDLMIDSFDDGPLLIAAAQSGLGLALVLEDMYNFYGDAGGLFRPFGEYVDTPFSYAIATKLASGNPHAAERFRKWIVTQTGMDSRSPPHEKVLETS